MKHNMNGHSSSLGGSYLDEMDSLDTPWHHNHPVTPPVSGQWATPTGVSEFYFIIFELTLSLFEERGVASKSLLFPFFPWQQRFKSNMVTPGE
jgi:hypothetical protein